MASASMHQGRLTSPTRQHLARDVPDRREECSTSRARCGGTGIAPGSERRRREQAGDVATGFIVVESPSRRPRDRSRRRGTSDGQSYLDILDTVSTTCKTVHTRRNHQNRRKSRADGLLLCNHRWKDSRLLSRCSCDSKCLYPKMNRTGTAQRTRVRVSNHGSIMYPHFSFHRSRIQIRFPQRSVPMHQN